MSGLVYKGDAVKGLGEFFPSILIDHVSIDNSSLNAQLAVYLPSFNNEAPSAEYLSNLQSKLIFYSVLGFDSGVIQQVIDREASIWSLAQLDTRRYFQGTLGGINYEQDFRTIQNLSLDFTSVSPEVIYDSSENMLFKYSFSVEILLAGGSTGRTAPQDWEEYFGAVGGYTTRGGKIRENRDITLFCFATTYDITGPAANWETKKIQGPYNEDLTLSFRDSSRAERAEDHIWYRAIFPTAPLPLIERNTGNVTYEHIFKDGVSNIEPTVAYVDDTGVYLDEVPLQSLDAKFYKPGTVTQEAIVDEINLLLTNSEPSSFRQGTEIELTGVVDSITYALKVYGKNADLVYQLNKIRKAFPERGGATKTGRLYEAYSQAIASINSRIKSNTEVKKQVYRNPTVVDSRTPPVLGSSTYSPPTEIIDDTEIIYADKFLLSREVYYANLGAGDDPAPAKALNWGYFFVDFEKILHQDTLITQMLNVGKIDKLFGPQLINSAVKIYKTKLSRIDNTVADQRYSGPSGNRSASEQKTHVKMETEFGDPEWTYTAIEHGLYRGGVTGAEERWQSHTWPQTKEVLWTSPRDFKSGGTTLEAALVATPGYGTQQTGTSYVALRAFTPLSQDGLYSTALGHDYRLMCFEFEDYYEVDFPTGAMIENTYHTPGSIDQSGLAGPVGNAYEIQVDVIDRSNEVLLWLKNRILTTLRVLGAYYNSAAESCSYNNTGDYFNSFFVDAMEAQYASATTPAPWDYAPTLYHMYLDLMDPDSNKSMAEIIEAAVLDSQKISPESGTFAELHAFANAFLDLYNSFSAISVGDFSWGQHLTYNVTITAAVEDVPVYVSAELRYEKPEAEYAWRSGGLGESAVHTFGTNWDDGDKQWLIDKFTSWASGLSSVAIKFNNFFEANDDASGNKSFSVTYYKNTTRKNTSPSEEDIRIFGVMYENPAKESGAPQAYLDAAGLTPWYTGGGSGTGFRNEFGTAVVFLWAEHYDRIS